MSSIQVTPESSERQKEIDNKDSEKHWIINILTNCECESVGVSSLTVKRFVNHYLKDAEVCDVDVDSLI